MQSQRYQLTAVYRGNVEALVWLSYHEAEARQAATNYALEELDNGIAQSLVFFSLSYWTACGELAGYWKPVQRWNPFIKGGRLDHERK